VENPLKMWPEIKPKIRVTLPSKNHPTNPAHPQGIPLSKKYLIAALACLIKGEE
jgi:hypothetical protein